MFYDFHIYIFVNFRHACSQCEYSGPSEAALRLHIQVFHRQTDKGYLYKIVSSKVKCLVYIKTSELHNL